MKSKLIIGLLLGVMFIGGLLLGAADLDIIKSKKMDFAQLTAEADILYTQLYDIRSTAHEAVDYDQVTLDMEMYNANLEEYEKYSKDCEAGDSDACLIVDMYYEGIETEIVTASAEEMTTALTTAKTDVEAAVKPFSELKVEKDLEELHALILDTTSAIVAYIDDAVASLEHYGDLDAKEYEAYVADISDTKELIKESANATYEEATRSEAVSE